MGLLICRRSLGSTKLELNKNSRDFLWSSVWFCWSQKMNLLMIYDIQILSLAFVGSLQNHCRKYFQSCLYLYKNDGFLTWVSRIRDFKGCGIFISALWFQDLFWKKKMMLDIICWGSLEDLSREESLLEIPCSRPPEGLLQTFVAQVLETPGPAFSTGHKATHIKTFHVLEKDPWCGFILSCTHGVLEKIDDRYKPI